MINSETIDKTELSNERLIFQWMQETPPNWSITRLRHLAREPLAYGANEAALEDSPNFPRFIRITDINEDGSLRSETFKSLAPEIAEPYLLKEGDVLLARSGATVGKAFIYKREWGKACFAGYLIKFRCNQKLLLPDFLFLFTKSLTYWSQIRLEAIQSTIQNFSAEKYGEIFIPLPPLSQQRQIADYLDRATQKIDALIAAKKRLLELLTEKRRALITQAVTRGLNPNVPLRDSAIEWLGEIPSHWKVVQLRWFVQALEQGWSPQADEREPSEDEWGVLKLNAVKDGKFDPSKAKALPQDLEIPENLEIQPSDFLVTRANTPDLVGNVCYVEQTRKRLMLSDLIYRLRLKENQLDGQFLSYFLQSPIGRSQIEIDARGSSASMVKISQGHILNWLLFVPPLKEQKEIVNYLDMKSSEIDALQTVTKHAIGLLQERRTSLISAAVTGQLPIPD